MAQTSLASSNNSNNTGENSEEVAFLSFAKEYIGLLASVASFPLLSSIFEIIPAPPGAEQLPVLSSFICIIVIILCFLLRSFLRRSKAGYIFMVVGGILAAIVCLMFYLEFEKFMVIPFYLRIPLYLLIHSLLIFCLGIVLVKVFTQRKSKAIQTLVDSHLRESAEEIMGIMENYIKMEEVKQKNTILEALADEILEPFRGHLHDLSNGSLEINRNTLIQVCNSLEEYAVSFDAVSDRDLDFWVNIGVDQIARDYFELNVNMMKRSNTRVTRIFILSRTDLKRDKELVKVLERHQSAKIGWAIVLYETIEYLNFIDTGLPLDFSFISTKDDGKGGEGSQILTYFRDYRNSSRRFRAVFNTEDNEGEFEEQIKNYRKILSYCWVANQQFKKVFENERFFPKGKGVDEQLKNEIASSNKYLKERIVDFFQDGTTDQEELDGQEIFMYEVSDATDIGNVVGKLRTLTENHEKWYDIGSTPSNCVK